MKVLKSMSLVALTLIASQVNAESNITIQPGSSILVEPDTTTRIRCEGSGGGSTNPLLGKMVTFWSHYCHNGNRRVIAKIPYGASQAKCDAFSGEFASVVDATGECIDDLTTLANGCKKYAMQ